MSNWTERIEPGPGPREALIALALLIALRVGVEIWPLHTAGAAAAEFVCVTEPDCEALDLLYGSDR